MNMSDPSTRGVAFGLFILSFVLACGVCYQLLLLQLRSNFPSLAFHSPGIKLRTDIEAI